MAIQESIIVGIVLTFLSYVVVIGIRRWSSERQFLDIPNERSLHDRPVPRGGGLVVVTITLSGVWILLGNRIENVAQQEIIIYIMGSTLIAFVGLLDDIFQLPSLYRLVVQLLGAFIVIRYIGYWNIIKIPILGEISLGWSGYLFTILWIVGLTNAYNFMDGIDGMAAGQAVIAGIGWFIIGKFVSLPLVYIIGLLIFSTCLGFLAHNWPPAKIFLGDIGSAFLGFTFAVLPLMIRDNPNSFLMGFFLVWPFVFDTFFTFIMRLLNRENVFSPHCSHLYQKLVISGLSHTTVSLIYISLSLIGMICSIILLYGLRKLEFITVLIILFCCFLLIFGLHRRERNINM